MKASSKLKRKRSEIDEVKDMESLLTKDKQKFLRAVKKLKQDRLDLMKRYGEKDEQDAMIQSFDKAMKPIA